MRARAAAPILAALALGCGARGASGGAEEDPDPVSAPTDPAPEGTVAGIPPLRVRPPGPACPRALVLDGGARLVEGPSPDAVACLDGEGTPDAAPVIAERVDVVAEGEGACGRRLRFTFRHDGVVVAGACGPDDALAVTAEGVRGVTRLVAIDDPGRGATLSVPWAGDWDADGSVEWLVRVERGGRVLYLGAFGLDPDDAIVPRAVAHRDEGG